jgi:hypothetical protein
VNSLKTSGQLSASSCQPFASPRRPDRLDASVYQRDSPRRFDACRTVSGRHSHPRLDRAGTKLSYCNGEIGAGSSNITPYMVWACKRPRWVAHTLQQMDGFSVEREKEVGEAREQDKASASGSVSAMELSTVGTPRGGSRHELVGQLAAGRSRRQTTSRPLAGDAGGLGVCRITCRCRISGTGPRQHAFSNGVRAWGHCARSGRRSATAFYP